MIVAVLLILNMSSVDEYLFFLKNVSLQGEVVLNLFDGFQARPADADVKDEKNDSSEDLRRTSDKKRHGNIISHLPSIC